MTEEEKKELEEYREFIQMLSETSDSRIFLNKGPEHAKVVLEQIFKQSKESVRIFAGNLTRVVGDDADYIAALSDFVQNEGSSVRILLNDYKEELAKESKLYMRLAYFKSKGKDIVVKSTNAKPYRKSDPEQKEFHFTVGDEKAYRIETDIKERKAEGSMNRTETAAPMAAFFDSLFDSDQSKVIDILKLFNYNELNAVQLQ